MCARGVWFRRGLLVAVVAVGTLGAYGCGYLKNLRDDTMDCFILGAGYTPAVVPTKPESKALGFLPPSIGVYVEATQFMHLGAIYKVSGDVEWDRRALGVVADRRGKVGLGPLHYVMIDQEVLLGNAYKSEDNQLDGWREHMRRLRDPIFQASAKELAYSHNFGLPYLYRGWQDWETFSLEIAIPEPFILHSGFNARVGFDPSQVFDLVLGVVGIDFYSDNAFRWWSGRPIYDATSSQ